MTVFARHATRPAPDLDEVAGAWRDEPAWPPERAAELDRDLEVLGHPRLQVGVAASAPVAFLSAKLCDVFPDGTSALVARGFLNLTHRRSHAEPAPLEPGVVEPVELELHATSWVFPSGHRLRLSLAGPTGPTRCRRRRRSPSPWNATARCSPCRWSRGRAPPRRLPSPHPVRPRVCRRNCSA